jgi:hypothetical protein
MGTAIISGGAVGRGDGVRVPLFKGGRGTRAGHGMGWRRMRRRGLACREGARRVV